VRVEVRDETGDGAAVGARFRVAIRQREGLVGARGFEPPTSSSRTMRATKLRHAPTEVLSDQSRWSVARVGQSRHGRRPAGELQGTAGSPGIPPGAAPDGPAFARPASTIGPVRCPGAPPGGLADPEVPGKRDPPVRTSHFARSALPVGSGNAPRAAILEWRERVAHLPSITVMTIAPRRNQMKQDLKARLFGLTVTLAFFGFAFLPHYGSRW
jgi:hypothetical protein